MLTHKPLVVQSSMPTSRGFLPDVSDPVFGLYLRVLVHSTSSAPAWEPLGAALARP